MHRATALAALALALAAAASGCGSSSAPPTRSDLASGRTLFSSSCGGCHSLTGHNAPSRQGGDLLHVHLPRGVALQYTREMPVRRKLTEAELGSVVDYILAVQRSRR